MSKVGFYCEKCELDSELEAGKGSNSLASWFEAPCPKCHLRLIRYRDNPKNDPYYRKSRKLRVEARRMAVDLIQPGQPGFQTYYKKAHEEIKKAKEEAEQKEEAKIKAREKFFKENRYSWEVQEQVKKELKWEEALAKKGL